MPYEAALVRPHMLVRDLRDLSGSSVVILHLSKERVLLRSYIHTMMLLVNLNEAAPLSNKGLCAATQDSISCSRFKCRASSVPSLERSALDDPSRT